MASAGAVPAPVPFSVRGLSLVAAGAQRRGRAAPHTGRTAQRGARSPPGPGPDPKNTMLGGLWAACACFHTLRFAVFPTQLPGHEPP